jgi:hypothetical protein
MLKDRLGSVGMSASADGRVHGALRSRGSKLACRARLGERGLEGATSRLVCLPKSELGPDRANRESTLASMSEFA